MLEPFLHVLFRLLTGMFLTGLAGSSIVVLITVAEDVRDFFGSEEGEHKPIQDGVPHPGGA